MCIYDMLFYICMLCVYTHVLIYTHMHRLEVWRLAARQADSRCLVRAARAFWHYCSSRCVCETPLSPCQSCSRRSRLLALLLV